jgi:hypothetical protein
MMDSMGSMFSHVVHVAIHPKTKVTQGVQFYDDSSERKERKGKERKRKQQNNMKKIFT